MTRVLRIITRLNTGGPTFHVARLARDLAERGFETVVAHGSASADETDLASAPALDGVERLHLPDLGRSIRVGRDSRALARVARAIRDVRPDIVHTHQSKAGWLGRRAAVSAGVSVVGHTFHGHVFHGYFPRPISALIRGVERRLAARTHLLFAPGERLADDIAAWGIAERSRIVAYPPSVDWETFDAEAARPGGPAVRLAEATAARARARGAVVFGIVGRLVPVKGHALLLEALARLAPERSFHLLVAGEGPLRRSLEKLARRLGLEDRVTFLGNVTERPPLYRALDAVVFASRNEGVPVAMLEAQASGRPVVAPRVGGIDEFLDPSTGKVIDPASPDALATALAELVDDPGARRRLGARAAEGARERFAPSRTAEVIARSYESALGAISEPATER